MRVGVVYVCFKKTFSARVAGRTWPVSCRRVFVENRLPGHQIFFKHGVRLVEAAEIQLEALGRPATYTVFILPYL